MSDIELKIEGVLGAISEEEKDNLKDWVRSDSKHSISSGGIGQTRDEMNEARRKWEDLGDGTKQAYKELVKLHREYVKEVLAEYKEHHPHEGVGEEDEGYLMGDDYILWDYLSSQRA